MVDSEADFTEDFLKKVNTEYQPEQVFLEYNGTWQMGTLMDMELPKYWMIVQQLATVDATTFDMYLANMRTMIMEQLFSADVGSSIAVMTVQTKENTAEMSRH